MWLPNIRRKRREELESGDDVPFFIGYLTMAMKVVPNLERAVRFAGEQLEGEMGRELKRSISEWHLRLHPGVSEGLSKFAKRWKRACPELEHSIHLIRSSVDERAGNSRARTLDRALKIVLQGARDRMRDFAASIYLPTLLIYTMGVLLPLVIVVILPVLSTINVQVGAIHVVILYCLVLPALVYGLSNHVLHKRPVTFRSPKLALRPCRFRSAVTSLLILVTPPSTGVILGAPPDITALAALWGVVLAVVFYLYVTTVQAFRRREELVRMENDLCDALLQLGNRIGEGAPAEEAFEHVSKTMNGTELAKVFREASSNIRFGGMGLRTAFFDEDRGALREVHSGVVRSTLKMLVDVIERSTRAAGEAILQMSDHLQKLRSTEAELRRSMGEVVTSMRSVALFFAPFVVSISARMQGVLSSKTASFGFLNFSGVSSPVFLLVLGIYVVILTVILVNYVVEIEFGGDGVVKRMAMVNALPVALGVFTAGAIIGGCVFGAIVG